MSSEIGSGHVSVVPKLTGFRKLVDAEMGAASAQGAKKFTRGFGSTGNTLGANQGKGFKDAYDKATVGTGLASSKALQSEYASAAKALSSARLKERDSLGKVRVAEQQLVEAREKYAAGSSQVIRAEERLAAVQRRMQTITESVRLATDRLTTAKSNLAAATESTSTAMRGGGFATFRSNLSSLVAPVTALTNEVVGLTNKAFGPAITSVTNFARGAGTTAVTSLKLAASAAQDFGLQLGLNVSNKLISVEQFLGNKFGPALSKLQPMATAVGQSFKGGFDIIKQAANAVLPVLSNVAKSVRSGLSTAFKSTWSAISQTGSFIISSLGTAITTVTNSVTALMSTAIFGGTQRLRNIENARARMIGLGFDTMQVAAAMDIADAAAQGTAFGFDELAGAASMAMTAGIAPGEQLVKYLETIKGAATASGASVSEIGQIFGKVRTSSVAYTTEITQLADRQIPIWKALSEEIGVSSSEVRKMASEGKITAEVFENAVLKATGGMAAAMAETTDTARKNAMASIKRWGIALMGAKVEQGEIVGGMYALVKPFFDMVKDGFNALSALILPVTSKIADSINARFLPAFQSASESFAKFKKETDNGDSGNILGDLLKQFEKMLPAVSALGVSFLPLMKNLPLVGSLFSGLTGPVGIVIALFTGIVTSSQPLQQALSNIVGLVGNMFSSPAFMQGAESVMVTITEVMKIIGDSLASVIVAIMPIITQLGQTFVDLIPHVTPLLKFLAELIALIAEGLASVIPMIMPIIDLFSQVLDQLLAAILPILPPIIEMIESLMPALIDLFNLVLPPIIAVATGILETLMPVVEGLMRVFGGLIDFVVGVFSGDWKKAWQGIQNIFGGFVDAIGGFVTGVLNWFRDLPGKIIDFFAGAGSWLFDVGKNIVDGLWNGLKNMWQGVVDWFGNAWNSIVGGAKDMLGIHSPSRVFMEIGDNVGAGLKIGLENKSADITKQVKSMASEMQTAFGNPQLILKTQAASSSNTAGSSQFVFNNYAPVGADLVSQVSKAHQINKAKGSRPV